MTTATNIAKALLKAPIILYRYTLSAFIGRECRYLPTCSEYAEEAIDKHGPLKGGLLALRRVLRCHPWGGSGYDPVPESDNARLSPADNLDNVPIDKKSPSNQTFTKDPGAPGRSGTGRESSGGKNGLGETRHGSVDHSRDRRRRHRER